MSDIPTAADDSPHGPDLAGMEEADIRAEVERIVASRLFQQADQPIRLLRFIVECALEGGEAPKEYRLAVEALGRRPEFDPRNDTIVRVQVRKLRAKLAKYYETEGIADPTVIDLPVGLYTAKFHKNLLAEAGAADFTGTGRLRRKLARGIWALLAVCAIAAAAFAVSRVFRAAPPQIQAPQLVRLTWDRNLYLAPALSGDGKRLVYVAYGGNGNLDLWLQDMGGGEPVLIAGDSFGREEPVISPDGKRVVFRSGEPQGGLSEMTVGSAEPPKRFSRDGRQPRYSPDGTQLTFWVPAMPHATEEPHSPLFFAPHTSVRALQHGKIFVTDQNTLKVRLLPLTLAAAGLPAWSPDGRFIVVYGSAGMLPFRQEDADWWVAPAVTTDVALKPVRTGIVPLLRRAHAEPVLYPPCWVGPKLYFSAVSGESVDLWEAQLSEGSHRVEGSIRKVSLGDGIALNPTASASGSLAFSVVTGDVNLWVLPVRADRGEPTGPLERITAGAAAKFWSSVSADGREVAYASRRFGSIDLFVKNLRTGGEHAVASAVEQPRMAPDGSQVVFSRAERDTAAIYRVGTAGGNPVRVLANGGEVTGWSADSLWVLHDRGAHLHGHRLDLGLAKDSEFSRHPVEDSYVQALSPDRQWVALICQSRLYLAPIVRGSTAPDHEWIQVTDGSDRIERARWSPNGNLLYFISDRDGHRCIWAQRLVAGTHQPDGPAAAVFHFHRVGPSMDHLAPEMVSFDVADDKLVMVLGEFQSTVFGLPDTRHEGR